MPALAGWMLYSLMAVGDSMTMVCGPSQEKFATWRPSMPSGPTCSTQMDWPPAVSV